ncbi:MAG: hypothetical protein MUC78_13255 [Bacteroidales bacterium]|nr:hypothetical protein [Bacteroidales bacterium]
MNMRLPHYSIRPGRLLLLVAFLSADAFAQNNAENPIPHFLFPQFTTGTILLKDGKSFTSLLNYNMAEERMITELNGTYRVAKNTETFDTIYIQNRKFVPAEKGFLELLIAGEATFYFEHKCNLTPMGSSVGYGQKSQSVGPTDMRRLEIPGDVVHIELPPNVEITPASVCWVRRGDEMFKFTGTNQFLKIFPEKGDQLKKYIRAEKINFKNREDILKLGTFCNQIL